MSLKIFEAFGIEAEYMIVDKKTKKVRHEVEVCLTRLNGGELTDEVCSGDVCVSNELVTHVIELKCNGPKEDLKKIEQSFYQKILEINKILGDKDAVLCGGASHPFMNPDLEMKLWPYGQKEIYSKYNEIFDCRGHGWSNLQSVHINLPYSNEEEFGRLHAAIRLILPMFPYLCASSPLIEGKFTEFPDQRLKYYEANQKKIPSITGLVVPERAFTFNEYENLLKEIYKDISPYDKDGILQHQWLNSRGAIVKFDVGAIEIRLMDIQESPRMDFALVSFFISLLKKIVNEEYISFEEQKKISEKDLHEIYLKVNSYNEEEIPLFYSSLFKSKKTTMKELILEISKTLEIQNREDFNFILKEGNLSKRIKKMFKDLSGEQTLMPKLVSCLEKNERFTLNL